jgi:DUF4097 and DUF4098 domain-containing protein YvlB
MNPTNEMNEMNETNTRFPMRTYDTPDPISISVELGVGDLRVTASDRTDTVVDVRPSNPSRKSDIAAAEQTRVEFANGTLVVKAQKSWRQWTPWGGGESIDVVIDVPNGSHLRATGGLAALHTSGRLGECHYKVGVGDVHVDTAGPVELVAGAGELRVDVCTGHAELKTASGAVHVGRVDGTATVKNSNGETTIGEITGDLRVSAANGRVVVEHAHAGVVVKTANGDVRLGDVASGTVVAHTAYGKIDVGVHDGTAAWLDLGTRFGTVRNELDDGGPPAAGEDTVEVRAQTSYGDITVRRAS